MKSYDLSSYPKNVKYARVDCVSRWAQLCREVVSALRDGWRQWRFAAAAVVRAWESVDCDAAMGLKLVIN